MSCRCRGSAVSVGASSTGAGSAVCPAGSQLTGGVWTSTQTAADATVGYNGPSSIGANAWIVAMANDDGVSFEFQPVAFCLES